MTRCVRRQVGVPRCIYDFIMRSTRWRILKVLILDDIHVFRVRVGARQSQIVRSTGASWFNDSATIWKLFGLRQMPVHLAHKCV